MTITERVTKAKDNLVKAEILSIIADSFEKPPYIREFSDRENDRIVGVTFSFRIGAEKNGAFIHAPSIAVARELNTRLKAIATEFAVCWKAFAAECVPEYRNQAEALLTP